MKICTCENRNCHYIFLYPLLPPACPDCGEKTVRLAAGKEIRDCRQEQKLLREEIRSGLFGWG